jgi:hypothetical protein
MQHDVRVRPVRERNHSMCVLSIAVKSCVGYWFIVFLNFFSGDSYGGSATSCGAQDDRGLAGRT